MSKTAWHTYREQNSYSSKLIQTLRRVCRSTPRAEAPRRSRAIREAADRILAIAGRGETRWSRAILSRRHLKLKKRRPLKHVYNRLSAKKRKRPQVLKCKAAVLRKLVPGGRSLSLPTLLEEVSDYVAALEMQVRAMASIATILSASDETC